MLDQKLLLAHFQLYEASVFSQNEIKRLIAIQEDITLGTQKSKSIQFAKLKIESAKAK